MSPAIEILRIPGISPYAEMLERQIERRDAIAAGAAPNALFLLEHAPVITLGRAASTAHLLKTPQELAQLGIALVETGRGGDATYHGPGQLVAYPLLNLRQWRCSVGWYLRQLETVLIALLADYGLEGERNKGLTGVWVGGGKVAAIGIGVRKWVTYHGIALNIAPNMEHFACIVPCGIPNHPVTSLAALLGAPPPLEEVAARFSRQFLATFEGAGRGVDV